MPKGHYTVREVQNERADTSFRSCVCWLGIFLLICTLIIIISSVTTNKRRTDKGDFHDSGGSYDAFGGSKHNASTPTSVSVTRTTPRVFIKGRFPTSTTSTTTTPSEPDDEAEDDKSRDPGGDLVEEATTPPAPPSLEAASTAEGIGATTEHAAGTAGAAAAAASAFRTAPTERFASAPEPTLVPNDAESPLPTTEKNALTIAANATEDSEDSMREGRFPPTAPSTTEPDDDDDDDDEAEDDKSRDPGGDLVEEATTPPAPPSLEAASTAEGIGATTEHAAGAGAAGAAASSSAFRTAPTERFASATEPTLVPNDAESPLPTTEKNALTIAANATEDSEDSMRAVDVNTESITESATPTEDSSEKSPVEPDATAFTSLFANSTTTTTPGTTVDVFAVLKSYLPAARTEPPEENVRDTLECRRLAARSLALMSLDDGVDACKDFYEFACGGLNQDPYLLPHNYWEDVWTRIEGQAKNISETDPVSYKNFPKYLKSCEQDGPNEAVWKELVKEELDSLGFTSKPINFTHIFTQLIKYESPIFFDVELDINTTDVGEDTSLSEFTLRIVPADVTENAFDFSKAEVRKCERTAASDEKDLSKTYRQITDCLKNDGLGSILTDTVEALKKLYNDTKKSSAYKLSLETIMGGINNMTLGETTARHRRILQDREYKEMPVAELNGITSLVNWTQLINGLTNGKNIEKIHVYDKEYLTTVLTQIHAHGDENIAEALEAWFLTVRYRQLLQSAPAAREPFFCVRRAASLMRGAASGLYLRSFDPAYVKDVYNNVLTIGRELKEKLEEDLEKVKHLSKKHKDKVDKLIVKIFENESDVDDGWMDKISEEYVISEGHFLNNTIHLMHLYRRHMYDLVGKDPTDFIWSYFLPIFDVRGKSIYELNTIAIPLGMMTQPFFHPNYPLYVQYAGLGFAIAHELAHHFDWTGIQYINGEKNDEYSHPYSGKINKLPWNFSDKVSGKFINYNLPDGHAKENEFFADRSGLTLAYRTYQQVRHRDPAFLPYLNLTTGRAFFVHAAQRLCTRVPLNEMVLDLFEGVHFPPPFRVAKTFATDVFFENFNCSERGNPPFPYILFEEEYGEGEDWDTSSLPSDGE